MVNYLRNSRPLAKLEAAHQDFSLPLDEVIALFAAMLSLALPDDRYPPLNVTPQQQKQQILDATVAWLLEEAERQPCLVSASSRRLERTRFK